jgi:hypothetical protein
MISAQQIRSTYRIIGPHVRERAQQARFLANTE